MSTEEFQRVCPAERAARRRAATATPSRALEEHAWPGNLRELEAVLERALLLYRTGASLGATEIRAALGTGARPRRRALGHS